MAVTVFQNFDCEVCTMRMRKIVQKNTLREYADKFLSYKKAQKVSERTFKDYQKYINDFIEKSQNSTNIEALKDDILMYFAAIPLTSPSRYNHPYQYLHAFFSWCAKQDYLLCNPFDKLDLKKVKDEGNVKPADISALQTVLNSLDKSDYVELRDYTIILLILDTGIRTSELAALVNSDYSPTSQSIYIRPEVAKTSRSRTLYLSDSVNDALRKFIRIKPKMWAPWLFPTRDGNRLQTNGLDRNIRTYCNRYGVKFTPYQIRHSFATFYLDNGGDLFTLQRQMGHADLKMTKRYTEVSDKLVNNSHRSYSPIQLLNPDRNK